jgi:hypothetical protein
MADDTGYPGDNDDQSLKKTPQDDNPMAGMQDDQALPQDIATPAAPPDGVVDRMSDQGQQADTNVDPTERYDAGVEAASGSQPGPGSANDPPLEDAKAPEDEEEEDELDDADAADDGALDDADDITEEDGGELTEEEGTESDVDEDLAGVSTDLDELDTEFKSDNDDDATDVIEDEVVEDDDFDAGLPGEDDEETSDDK